MSSTFRRFAAVGALVLVAVAAALAVAHTADAKKAGEWPFYSADNRATKYSAADQINKDNVAEPARGVAAPAGGPGDCSTPIPAFECRTGTPRRRSW